MFSKITNKLTFKSILSKYKIAIYASLSLVVIVIMFVMGLLFFPDLYLNQYFKYRIIKEVKSAYPEYSINIADLRFNVLKNRIELGKVEVNSGDSSFMCSVDKSYLKGISWIHLVLKGVLVSGTFSSSVVDGYKILLKFRKSQYEIRCSRLFISLNNSEILAYDLELHPLVDDKQFFEVSNFRRTRFHMVLPLLKVSGLSYFGFKPAKMYHARFIKIQEISLDLLINKNKPFEPDSTIMPKEMLLTLKDVIHVDSLSILKGQIKYGESDSVVSNHVKKVKSIYTGYSINFSDLHFNLLKNFVEFGSLGVISHDSDFTCKIKKSSLGGINWLHLIWNGDLVPEALASSVLEAKEIVLNSQELEYGFRFGKFHLSIPDSEIVANDLKINPLISDNQFFDESNLRKTRFSTFLKQLKISGVDFPGLILGKKYIVRIIQIRDVSLDILVNMYKPYERFPLRTPMLNEMLSSVKEIIQIDSLRIINGNFKYGESYAAHSNPAVITFENAHLLAVGIANNKNHNNKIIVHANSNFMGEGLMKAELQIPLSSSEFSLQYSGSLTAMNLEKLNTFIEIAEHKRIKSGTLQFVSFEIQVNNGKAKGYVRAEYNNLMLALLDSKTGSEKGFMNKMKSFLANTFKLKGTNQKDNAGIVKLGDVKYSRMHDDTFVQYVWFALRSGVADIIGF